MWSSVARSIGVSRYTCEKNLKFTATTHRPLTTPYGVLICRCGLDKYLICQYRQHCVFMTGVCILASIQSEHNKASMWSRWQEYSCTCCNISSSWCYSLPFSRHSWLHQSDKGYFPFYCWPWDLRCLSNIISLSSSFQYFDVVHWAAGRAFNL